MDQPHPSPYFKRTELLIGHEGLAQLKRATVTVVGLGAVGSFVTECLVRSGIGNLRLIDFDTIHETNVNRQLFALPGVVGQKKTMLAVQRVRAINPDCQVTTNELFINPETVENVIAGPHDILIDAIDGLNSKACLIQSAYEHQIPIISVMGTATRTDPTAVRIADLSKTYNCPLAKFIRKRLGKRGIRKGISCVFSCELPNRHAVSEETDCSPHEVRSELGHGRARKTLGSFCSIPGIFGLTAAQHAINTLLSKEPPTL